MSKHRLVSTCFWDDGYIARLDPSEKLLFLYLLTNPLTGICGVYQIELRRIAFDTGFDQETAARMLARFERDDKCVYRDGWIAMRNWVKHQSSSPKVQRGIEIQLAAVPEELAQYIRGYPIDTVSHLNLNPNSNPNPNSKNTLSGCEAQPDDEITKFIKKQEREEKRIPVTEIVDYFNAVCKTSYKPKSGYIHRLLKARWNEGFRLDDFKTVIDLKMKQWGGDPKMVAYLRPATLFAPSHFEGYLNEAAQKRAVVKKICPQCGAADGRHTESCPTLGGGDGLVEPE